jgi:MinD-like ATPase involved in chromosome partitioning or flagellar assembly
MLGNRSGKVVTFYSYKGGTGRTMAAANMAWILAGNGRRVLLIDWDLESPGLHLYLRPFLADPDLTNTAGLIDFACEAARVAGTRKSPSLMDYIVGVKWSFPAAGSIDLLAAGRQDEGYQALVNTFGWRDFLERRGGNRLFEGERAKLKANYDYVLIDSRTGASDTSGICTMQMPDQLVVLFTLNHQSIEGAAAAAASIQAKRSELPIFPVPTRLEYAELDKLSAATAFARRMFAPFLLHVQSDRRAIDPRQQASYWQDVETPYVAYYAFEEIPAAFKDESGSPRGLLASSERLTSWITDRTVNSLQTENDEHRRKVLGAFAFDQKQGNKFDWVAPAKRGGPLGAVKAIWRRWGRYRWQAATAVLACFAMSALYWPGPAVRPPQVATLTAQLEQAVQDLSRVQAFASDPSDSPKFPKGDFADGFAILQRMLAQLKTLPQTSPGSARKDGVAPSPGQKQ